MATIAPAAATASARQEFASGWPVLSGALLGVMFSVSSLPLYVSGVFIHALGVANGWSRVEVSTGTLIWTATLALAFPFMGMLIDRVGLRRPLLFSLLAASACYCGLALMPKNLAVFYALQMALALFGAAATPVVYTRAINSCFDRARGRALGIALMGTGICAMFAPGLVTYAIEAGGSWRAGYLALAVVTIVATPAIVWLIGLPPQSGERQVREAAGQDFATAVRSRIFWLSGAAFAMLSIAVSGMIVHFVPLMIDYGASPQLAAETAGLIGVAIIIGRVSVGFAVDRFPASSVAATTVVFAILGVASLIYWGYPARHVAAVALGLGMGAEVDLIGYMTARYFGLRAYGRIYGLLYGAFTLGTGVSPLWIGALRENSGSYQSALAVILILFGISLVLFLAMPAAARHRPLMHTS